MLTGAESADSIDVRGLGEMRGVSREVKKPLVVVREIAVPIDDLSPGLAGLRIAHVSDFHFRRWTPIAQTAQDLLLAVECDLVVGTGDFGARLRKWTRAAELMRRFFDPVARRRPVYAVLGNHDTPGIASYPGQPAVCLTNESVRIEHRGSSFRLAGVDQTLPAAEDLDAALADCSQAELTILLAHYPSTVHRLPRGKIDLQLSGHTHGGQIRLPYVGCVWPNDRIARRIARGLHRVGGTYLHVNPGIGASPPIPIRVRCPAEISVLTLQPTGCQRPPEAGEHVVAYATH